MRKRLELVKGASAKFWEVAVAGSGLTVTFGRIGTKGQIQLRSFDTPAAAKADATKQLTAKLAKGYAEVKAKAAKEAAHPFLFVGDGVDSSYKCLECYAWFVEAPSAAERKRILAKLPRPLTSFARFSGDLLHFGSDDLLETYVQAAYDAAHAKTPYRKAVKQLVARATNADGTFVVTFPTTKQWTAFAEDFAHAMKEIHAHAKLRLALKADDETMSRRSGRPGTSGRLRTPTGSQSSPCAKDGSRTACFRASS